MITSLIIPEPQIKTILRFYLTSVRIAKINIISDSSCWQKCRGRWRFLHYWWECKLIQPQWISIYWFYILLGINLPQDPAILHLGIYSKNAPFYHRSSNSTTIITTLFIIARNCKQLKCSSTEEWIKKML